MMRQLETSKLPIELCILCPGSLYVLQQQIHLNSVSNCHLSLFAMALCACKCERQVSRRTEKRHLAGAGSKSASTTRERNLRREHLRYRSQHPCVARQRKRPSPSLPLAPSPNPMPVDDLLDIDVDINLSEPWAGSPSLPSNHIPSISHTATNLGLRSGAWQIRNLSIDEEVEDDADADAGTDDDIECLGGWEDSSDEEDGPGDDGFPSESRLQGMSAADVLAEEFEVEAAHRGMFV